MWRGRGGHHVLRPVISSDFFGLRIFVGFFDCLVDGPRTGTLAPACGRWKTLATRLWLNPLHFEVVKVPCLRVRNSALLPAFLPTPNNGPVALPGDQSAARRTREQKQPARSSRPSRVRGVTHFAPPFLRSLPTESKQFRSQ